MRLLGIRDLHERPPLRLGPSDRSTSPPFRGSGWAPSSPLSSPSRSRGEVARPRRDGEGVFQTCFIVATPRFRSGSLIGWEDGRPFSRSSFSYVRPRSRPSGMLPSTVPPAIPWFSSHGQHTASRFEGRTWGFITQPRTAARPTRRPPAQMFGGHPFPRAGKGHCAGGFGGGDKLGRRKMRDGGKWLGRLGNYFERRENAGSYPRAD
jgi:hypothetical protein